MTKMLAYVMSMKIVNKLSQLSEMYSIEGWGCHLARQPL